MNYRFIKYARTRTLPNHENERIEVSVELSKGEDPERVFADAKDFVDTKLGFKRPRDRGPMVPGPIADQPTKAYVDRTNGATLGDALAAKGQTL